MEALQHQRDMILIGMAGVNFEKKAVEERLSSLDNTYRNLINIIELRAGKMTKEEVEETSPSEESMATDDDRTKYLQLINEKTDTFSSVDEIIERLNYVQAMLSDVKEFR